MAHDIFLGKTKRNWSREKAAANPEYEAQYRATARANKVARLQAIKLKADSGDKKAQKKWAKINKRVAKIHLKAAKGNLKAAKQLAALNSTGLFVTTVGPSTLKTAMRGTFVGKDEILGTFVGADSVTRIRGNDKLTEIVTAGGAFVGNDKLTEIITSGANAAEEKIEIYELLRQKTWQKPFPIAIDKKDAESAPADETVRGIPFKDFLSVGIKNGKIVLTSEGSRIFFIGKRGIVASQRPSA